MNRPRAGRPHGRAHPSSATSSFTPKARRRALAHGCPKSHNGIRIRGTYKRGMHSRKIRSREMCSRGIRSRDGKSRDTRSRDGQSQTTARSLAWREQIRSRPQPRQAYDIVVMEDSVDAYEEFLLLYPYDPLAENPLPAEPTRASPRLTLRGSGQYP